MDRRCHHDAGVEIDRVLGLVSQMRRSVLHLGDLGVGVGRALPVGVRQRLALALAVEARQVLGVGVSIPLSCAIRVVCAIALAAVAPHDRAQRGVGLYRRASTPIRSPSPGALGHELQHRAEHVSCASCGRRERVRDSQEWSGTFSGSTAQEIAQRDSAQRHAMPRSLSI